MGSSRAFHELRRLVTGFSPNLLFICETKVTANRCNRWRTSLNFDGQLVVDSKGASGGLLLFWKEPCDISICSYSQGHIDCVIKSHDITWRFTGFYGNPEVQQRKHSWSLMKRLACSGSMDIPWLMGGDFNEIINSNECCDRCRRPWAQMNDFNIAIQYCGLKTIPCDSKFTWFNQRKNEDARFLRLDRFLCNRRMDDIFSFCSVQALDPHFSDHNPLLLTISSKEDKLEAGNGFRRFFFEQKWLLDKTFAADLLTNWSGFGGQTLHHRLEGCQLFLEKWAKTKFDKISKQIKELRKKRLFILKNKKGSKSFYSDLRKITKEIEKLCEAEELHWKQRSRVNWLGLGDRNTKYFHAFACKRRKKNTIKCLLKADGSEVFKEEEMAVVVSDFFASLFHSSSPSNECIDKVTDTCSTFLGNHPTAELTKPFTAEEVRRALFQMHPHKAPGPDGFPPYFFHKFWGEIGEAVTNDVLRVLDGRDSIRHWNKTLIVLIPKTKEPKELKNFRPISLCNTTYKLVAKVLANRMRTVLGWVIDDSQSAFIPGRLISDNIILGYECMHWMKNKKHGNDGYAAAKLDMSKAFDKVEWRFMRAMMSMLRFPPLLIDLVLQCVSSVEFSFVINCKVYGSLIPSRGLRQGCPLSPFLFVICAQGFSSLLRGFENQGLLSGITMARHCPSITNLFFADDSLIFFRANEEGAKSLGDVLHSYELASGQTINLEKSTICFSPNMSPACIEKVTTILSIRETAGHSLYLGLPTSIPRKKKLQFEYLRDSVTKKLDGWDNKLFSAGGKETLIKSVIQSIPTYAMAVFRIPVGICTDIEKSCANFWWGDGAEGRKLHWARWDKLCLAKSRGGLGFRRFVQFNQALLAKQVWRLIKHPESLISRVLKARYFRDCDIMKASISSNCSFVWRSFCWGRELLEKGLRWKVGNGKKVSVFHDKWIPRSRAWAESVESTPVETDLKVSDLIARDGTWDKDKLHGIFPDFFVSTICSMKLPIDNKDDSRFWMFDEKGRFSVKSGYLCATDFFVPLQDTSDDKMVKWWKEFWTLRIPPKVLHFGWRALHDLIAMNQNLCAHHVPIIPICHWCRREWGSTTHGLLWCDRVRQAWKKTEFWAIICSFKHLGFQELCSVVKQELGIVGFERWLFFLWLAWKFLCDLKHDKIPASSELDLCIGERMLDSYHLAREQVVLELHILPEEGSRQWFPPPEGVLRVDVDVALREEGVRSGMGFIVRDFQGRTILAGCQTIGFSETVLMGELHAILLAIGSCLEHDTGPVVVYSDSLLATHVLSDKNQGSDSLCDDLWEVFAHARQHVVVDFFHMRREANRAAHELARLSLSFTDAIFWKADFPNWLLDIVISDSS
ncbi:uncharacterized protein LOC131018358 [Salvia miltiorrhiza]|uniref:uncharacterized protein LOC131018358 n=1 Tax=Salvia miltiorrhiza TaxID=226208 RepID=UPI0025ACC6B1|nr:uncharacterized protein LOC131018358 [Salvia miltiorrhiza]